MWRRTLYPDELMHHGIEGQRWGKRNGPPYPLDSSQKSSAERKYRTDKGYHKNQNGSKNSRKKKDISRMSNKELESHINRMQLEQRYNELDSQRISRGRQKVMSLIRDYAVLAGAIATTTTIVKNGLQIKSGKFGK